MQKKLKKYLKYIYNEKLIYEERYYVDLVIYYIIRLILKLLGLLNWIFKHDKLTVVFSLILTGIVFYILIYIFAYFLIGFNLFLEKVGLEEVIEFEKKIYHLYLDSQS